MSTENTQETPKVPSRALRMAWYKTQIQEAKLETELKELRARGVIADFQRLEAIANMAQLQAHLQHAASRPSDPDEDEQDSTDNQDNTTPASEQPAPSAG